MPMLVLRRAVYPRVLQVPAFAGRVWESALLCALVRVEFAAGREQVVLGAGGGEKFFVRVTEC